jgi:hypothetical protein
MHNSVKAFLFVRKLSRLIIFYCVYDALPRFEFLGKRRDPMVCVIYGLFVVYCMLHKLGPRLVCPSSFGLSVKSP